jgi:hypothetical protein
VRQVAAVAAEAVAKAPIKRVHPTSREHRTRKIDPGGNES